MDKEIKDLLDGVKLYADSINKLVDKLEDKFEEALSPIPENPSSLVEKYLDEVYNLTGRNVPTGEDSQEESVEAKEGQSTYLLTVESTSDANFSLDVQMRFCSREEAELYSQIYKLIDGIIVSITEEVW